MSVQKEVIISGVGGQGMMLCGTMLAKAAVIYDHKRATMSTEYGTETRGTFAKSEVIISDDEIFFPDVMEPNLIVCLHQIAYNRYYNKIDHKTLLLYNSDELTPAPTTAAHEKGLPITKLARELGNPSVSNILILGAISSYLNAASPHGIKRVIREFFQHKGENVVAINERAFEIGFQLGQKL